MKYLLTLLVSLISGVLNYIGGRWWLPARRFIMPFVIGLAYAWYLHTWWLLPAIYLPMMGILLGIPDHIRWLYCLMVAIGTSIVLACFGFIPWWGFGVYCAYNCILGLLTVSKKWTDFATGAGYGSVGFFV